MVDRQRGRRKCYIWELVNQTTKYYPKSTSRIPQEFALADVAQWIESWPAKQRVAGSIPSWGTCLGFWPHPQ